MSPPHWLCILGHPPETNTSLEKLIRRRRRRRRKKTRNPPLFASSHPPDSQAADLKLKDPKANGMPVDGTAWFLEARVVVGEGRVGNAIRGGMRREGDRRRGLCEESGEA